MQCTVSGCQGDIPPSSRFCPVCNADAGFPNVRLAQEATEIGALQGRLKVADQSLKARQSSNVMDAFVDETSKSVAIIARGIGDLHSLVKSDNSLYISFHYQVDAGARIPESNGWDQWRVSAEAAVLPNFHQSIVYACLSLDGLGASPYGDYFIELKESAIALRASVFEENTVTFCRRHNVVAGTSVPPGYRASWGSRADLAKAKLYGKIQKTTTQEEFPHILLGSGSGTGDIDFVEVHIFGPVHRKAISKVRGPRPSSGADAVLWDSIKNELGSINVPVEEL